MRQVIKALRTQDSRSELLMTQYSQNRLTWSKKEGWMLYGALGLNNSFFLHVTSPNIKLTLVL